jgi:hypothetical protein
MCAAMGPLGFFRSRQAPCRIKGDGKFPLRIERKEAILMEGARKPSEGYHGETEKQDISSLCRHLSLRRML